MQVIGLSGNLNFGLDGFARLKWRGLEGRLGTDGIGPMGGSLYIRSYLT